MSPARSRAPSELASAFAPQAGQLRQMEPCKQSPLPPWNAGFAIITDGNGPIRTVEGNVQLWAFATPSWWQCSPAQTTSVGCGTRARRGRLTPTYGFPAIFAALDWEPETCKVYHAGVVTSLKQVFVHIDLAVQGNPNPYSSDNTAFVPSNGGVKAGLRGKVDFGPCCQAEGGARQLQLAL